MMIAVEFTLNIFGVVVAVSLFISRTGFDVYPSSDLITKVLAWIRYAFYRGRCAMAIPSCFPNASTNYLDDHGYLLS